MFDASSFLSAIEDATAGGFASHMPFVASDGVALCSLKRQGGQWKAHAWLAGERHLLRVETGLHDSAVECCPQATITSSGTVSFSVVSDHPASFTVHGYSGHSMLSLAPTHAAVTSHAGFWHGGQRAHCTKRVSLSRTGPTSEDTVSLEMANGRASRIRFLNNKQVMHIAPMLGGSFAVTLFSRLGGEESIVITHEEGAIRVATLTRPDGSGFYKPHVYGGFVLYADKIGDGFEDRVIKVARDYISTPMQVSEWVEVLE